MYDELANSRGHGMDCIGCDETQLLCFADGKKLSSDNLLYWRSMVFDALNYYLKHEPIFVLTGVHMPYA